MDYIRLCDIDLKSKINTRVYISFLAKDVTIRLQKDKTTKYIALNMVDRDKIVDAKIFGIKEHDINTIQNGRVYNAAVDVKVYEKSPNGFSCIIYNWDFSNENPENYVDWADNLEECKVLIEKVLTNIVNTSYGKIAYNLIANNWSKFARWTAATSQHHTKLGELLVHTAEVVRLCDMIANTYNKMYSDDFINKPLLLSAAIIHDLGKIKELDVNTSFGSTEYSVNSSLSSHIMNILDDIAVQAYKFGIGVQIDTENDLGELEGIKSDEQLLEEREAVDLLRHCVGAHHGRLEYGSPIEPSIPEAVILHIADSISAEMYKYNKIYKELESGDSLSVWTNNGYKSTYKESNKI